MGAVIIFALLLAGFLALAGRPDAARRLATLAILFAVVDSFAPDLSGAFESLAPLAHPFFTLAALAILVLGVLKYTQGRNARRRERRLPPASRKRRVDRDW